MNLKSFFDGLNEGIRGGEQSMVNFFSAVGPWLAPLAPAYSSWHHMTTAMGFPNWVSWAIAAVVEILGLSAVSTVISFWSYNRRKMADYKKAPVWVALVSFIFYLAIILIVNVLLDLAKINSMGWDVEYVKVAANGFLSLLSVPAAIILAVRTQHHELLDDLAKEKAEKDAEKKSQRTVQRPQVVYQSTVSGGNRSGKGNGSGATNAVAFHRQKRLFMLEYKNGLLQEKLAGRPMKADVLAELYGTSPRTAFRWLREIQNGNGSGG